MLNLSTGEFLEAFAELLSSFPEFSASLSAIVGYDCNLSFFCDEDPSLSFSFESDFQFLCDEDPAIKAELFKPNSPDCELQGFVAFHWQQVLDSRAPVFVSEPLADSDFVEGAAWERFLLERFGHKEKS